MTGPADKRYIGPGACSWCGHDQHAGTCPKTIRRGKDDLTAPCPCTDPKGAQL